MLEKIVLGLNIFLNINIYTSPNSPLEAKLTHKNQPFYFILLEHIYY